MPDEEPHQDVTFDSGEGNKETSQGMENEETNANHNFDSAVMKWLNESFCSKCMRPAMHCTEGLLFNDDEEFIQFFKDRSTLMKRLLASYVVGKPSFNTLNDIETFMDKRHGYHLNSFDSSCIKDHFFRTFKREHFYIVRSDRDSSVSVMPTFDLYTFDENLYNQVKNQIKGIFDMFTNNGVINKLRTHVNESQFRMYSDVNDASGVLKLISSVFKFAWDLQADGFQTNAMLTNTSIVTLVDRMLALNIFHQGDVIVDCGSSYGSLLLSLINIIKLRDPQLHMKAVGLEYAVPRVVLGSFCMKRIIEICRAMDYMPLVNLDFQNKVQDLFHMTSFSDDVTHVIAFDKAFGGILCLHNALLVMNSKNVKYFITVKGHFSKGKNKCMLGSSSASFALDDLLNTMGFELVSKLPSLLMNGSENSGSF
jgi:hypothetical protein